LNAPHRSAGLALATALALTLLAPVASAKRVRVFAVGPKFDLSWVDTRAHYHDKLFALFDRRLRTPGAPTIQRGADDVASHLLGPADRSRPAATARDLVTLPEDVGLMASFTGSLGVPARASQAGVTGAIGGLLVSYAPQVGYYHAKYPGLAARPFPPTRALGLALTDTFGRVAVETFAELADRYDVYLEAGVNMAYDWQVVCVEQASYAPPAGKPPCAEENAGKVAALRSPDEPSRAYAYEATSDRTVNMALIFDPDGRLVSRQVKTYITPVELPGQLDLAPGAVSAGLSALRTPVGTLGFVTSKDAWMPDVLAKLDQAHVEILVQPEFFVNDTVRRVGMWAPDNLAASGYSALLRAPSFEAMVLPSMTGNVFDFSADAQQGIAVKPRANGAQRRSLVGQPRAPGWSAVGSWVVRDPLSPEESITARRRRLGEAGERLLPTGPPCPTPDEAGPCRGGQVEGVIFDDLEVGDPRAYRRARLRRRGRTPFSRSRALSRSRVAQRNVALAARGRRVYAVFEESRPGGDGRRDQVYLVSSRDAGQRWRRRVRPTGRPSGAATEWWPALAVTADGTVWVVWQDDSSGTPRIYFARSRDGMRFSPPAPVDATAPPRGGG
jgi:predicted amidohydrolase